jgi:hypothetical protein
MQTAFSRRPAGPAPARRRGLPPGGAPAAHGLDRPRCWGGGLQSGFYTHCKADSTRATGWGLFDSATELSICTLPAAVVGNSWPCARIGRFLAALRGIARPFSHDVKGETTYNGRTVE